jgi:hypothetical protein
LGVDPLAPTREEVERSFRRGYRAVLPDLARELFDLSDVLDSDDAGRYQRFVEALERYGLDGDAGDPEHLRADGGLRAELERQGLLEEFDRRINEAVFESRYGAARDALVRRAEKGPSDPFTRQSFAAGLRSPVAVRELARKAGLSARQQNVLVKGAKRLKRAEDGERASADFWGVG